MTLQTDATNPCVVLIGFGTAGVNAAMALRANGYEGRIVAITKASATPASPVMISHYVAGEKTLEECQPWRPAQLAMLNIEFMEGCEVTAIDPCSHTIITSADEVAYTKCVIASGSSPVAYTLPGDAGYAPLTLRTADDAKRMREAIGGGKRILVSGSSMVAMKMLDACLAQGCTCTLVARSERILRTTSLASAADALSALLESRGIELKLGCTIDRVSGQAGSLSVTFSDGSAATFDEIAVAHGMTANLGFVADTALARDDGLLVDEFMRTSDADIYAAGDVAQALELASGEKRCVRIWKNAARQGACAGAAIAAELAGASPDPTLAYTGSIPTNTIEVGGALIITGGVAQNTDSARAESHKEGEMQAFTLLDDAGHTLGYTVLSTNNEPGGIAYDTAAMLQLRVDATYRS